MTSDTLPGATPPAEPGPEAGTARRRTSIMVLDDEPIVCKRLKPFFQKAGYEVEAYSQPWEALARIEQRRFDVVITDLKMEGLDGLSFLGKVKSLWPDTDVVVITGFATMETARQSFRKGVFDCVAKPFKLAELRDCVQRIEKERGLVP